METEALATHKKKSTRLGAHLVFADESGFLLIPHVVRTWSPQAALRFTIIAKRRDKVSVISGISVSPRRQRLGLYYQLYFSTTSGRMKFACFSASCYVICAAP